MIGKAVGNYTITRKLGRGGMGAVYLGEHSLIGRRAAIKVLLPELSHDEQLVARLFNEAKLTTVIRHPGIVEVFDFGYHHDGSAYLVMEHLEGVSLRDRLVERRRVDTATGLEVCEQICAALLAAHDAGVIHRDLKPDNLLSSPTERSRGASALRFSTSELPSLPTTMARVRIERGRGRCSGPRRTCRRSSVAARARSIRAPTSTLSAASSTISSLRTHRFAPRAVARFSPRTSTSRRRRCVRSFQESTPTLSD